MISVPTRQSWFQHLVVKGALRAAAASAAWRALGCAAAVVMVMAMMWGAAPVHAHEMSMAELELREFSKGEFTWAWGQSGKASRSIADDLTVVWPEGCMVLEQSLKCGPAGLVGNVSVDGVGKAYSAALLRVNWQDGQARVYTITAAQPKVYLYGAAEDHRSLREIVLAYTVLGVQHILSGIDHLFFVFGLLFLVGFSRRLVGTITAFTVAHSLTLASSALGWLTLRSAPVEAMIALSIMLVASEALRSRETLAKRWPALVAFVFGLVHGLGFAGALKDIGLPQDHLIPALLTFNLGVEMGQLLVVGLVWGITRFLSRFRWFGALRTPLLYGMGAMAGFWSLQRLIAIAG